jgi:hypothetical protein
MGYQLGHILACDSDRAGTLMMRRRDTCAVDGQPSVGGAVRWEISKLFSKSYTVLEGVDPTPLGAAAYSSGVEIALTPRQRSSGRAARAYPHRNSGRRESGRVANPLLRTGGRLDALAQRMRHGQKI